jgi:hypothetical protein
MADDNMSFFYAFDQKETYDESEQRAAHAKVLTKEAADAAEDAAESSSSDDDSDGGGVVGGGGGAFRGESARMEAARLEREAKEAEPEPESKYNLSQPVKKKKGPARPAKVREEEGEGVTAETTKRVYLGRLPKQTTEAEIRRLLLDCGPIDSILNSWGHVPELATYKGVALVNFVSLEGAQVIPITTSRTLLAFH